MATTDRPKADSLIRRLEEAPYSFDFFQAVRRIACAHPHLPQIGHSRHSKEDPVRFCQKPSLAFAPSTIRACSPGSGGPPPSVWINFFGLLGPNGPLPLHITEWVRERIRHHGDETLARFLDIFHHRMVSLFYRAWASSQQTVNYESTREDRYALYIGSLFGVGMPSFRDRDAVPDVAKLHYSGHLASATSHAEGLRAILSDYFGIAADVEELVGEWIDLPLNCCCRLGDSPQTGSLGSTAIVGSRIWQCQHKFRLKLGPMWLREYERMLPGGESLLRLIAWVRNYAGDELLWDVQLILKAEEVPQIRLAQAGRLGWTTWLSSQPREEDADDLVLRPAVA